MSALIFGTTEWHVTTPLVGHGPLVHNAADDSQHVRVKKQFRGEAGWLEWHRQKMPMRPTVRLVAMGSGNRTEPGKTLYGTRQLIASEDGREVRKTRAPVGH